MNPLHGTSLHISTQVDGQKELHIIRATHPGWQARPDIFVFFEGHHNDEISLLPGPWSGTATASVNAQLLRGQGLAQPGHSRRTGPGGVWSPTCWP